MNDVMLIVDDVEINRAILKIIFEKNFEIIEAENGEEALAILEGCQGNINVVLLDLMMPGFSGFDVLEKREKMAFFQKIPVVVITSSDNMEDQIKAFDLGANEYISKPFVPEIVMSRVNNVMASNRRMLSIEMEAQKMKIKSELDEMTGIYNKTTTEYSMNQILDECNGELNVMMIIDIDNFKAVNDLMGHQTGDHVIKTIANLISGIFRKTDIVGRIGGDEFCVMMVDVPNMEIVYSKVNELMQKIKYKPGLSIPDYVSLSIGVAANDRKCISYTGLFKKADSALYDAKQAGKACYREYGVEPLKEENDERPVALLLSSNRNVFTTVLAMVPSYIRIIEMNSMDDLEKLNKSDIDKTMMMFVDVTNYEGDSAEVWKRVRGIEWIEIGNVLAICEEGNIAQYMAALNSGIADMLTTPIDKNALKRRINRQLEKNNFTEINP